MADSQQYSSIIKSNALMKKIEVQLEGKKRSYPIVIGKNILSSLPRYFESLKLPRDLFIVTNNHIKKQYARWLKEALRKKNFTLKFYPTLDSEKAKSIASAVRLVEALADYSRQRKIAVVALGGGVVGDLASFIASIYKRGVPLIHLPTTLLAQIDSSIGGKTAIDLALAKNLVGTFYQPRLVFCDLSFLLTLDKRQLRAGLAEALKYAIIKDRNLFYFLEENYRSILSKDLESLEHLVFECARIKAKIVASDEKEEKGLRTILNFGHTIGHAIEAAGNYERYSHGEAVAMGMFSACRISQNLGFLEAKICQRIIHLIAAIGFTQEITGIREEDVLMAYRLDKKFVGKVNRLVLIKDIAKPWVCQNIPEKIIKNAVRELFVI